MSQIWWSGSVLQSIKWLHPIKGCLFFEIEMSLVSQYEVFLHWSQAIKFMAEKNWFEIPHFNVHIQANNAFFAHINCLELLFYLWLVVISNRGFSLNSQTSSKIVCWQRWHPCPLILYNSHHHGSSNPNVITQ